MYLSHTGVPFAKQLVQMANEHGCSVSAVQSTRENNLPYFGIVSGAPTPRTDGLYQIDRVMEKPTPTYAEQELVTSGLRTEHYLGFFATPSRRGQQLKTQAQLDPWKRDGSADYVESLCQWK